LLATESYVIPYFAVALLSYLIGSIPAGYLVGRYAGVDIRRVGSGNIGATNVLRVLGKPFGYGVFLFDFLKGVAAVRLSILIINRVHAGHEQAELVAIAAGVLCVIGHVYPIWLRFKGGKGVATSVGVLFGLMPLAALMVMVIWLIIFQITKYVSIASVIAALALPFTVLALVHIKKTNSMTLVYFSICLTLVIVWRHRSNLSRLMKGTEQSFKKK
jgi:acyl phosphate:glycerol-3-phosphate acyltransferase